MMNTMSGMSKGSFVLAVLAAFLAPSCSWAAASRGEYGVAETTTQLGANSWKFTFDITNNNQQNGFWTGLDGFFIQVPNSAVISNVTVPTSFSGGSWISGVTNGNIVIGPSTPEAPLAAGNSWLYWWGLHPESVYPRGTTTFGFSFQADGVSLGSAPGGAVTYWGYSSTSAPYVATSYGNYSAYTSVLTAPVASLTTAQIISPVPEPGEWEMMLAGFCLVGAFVRRHKQTMP